MFQTIDHPLISDELTRLRDPACPSAEFRQRLRRIASLMVPAVTADLETHVVPCTTPLEITSGEAVRSMKEAGATSIRFACLVAAPEGVSALECAYPDVPIHAACLDRCLNGLGYILPGLGDAGDRMFGTGV